MESGFRPCTNPSPGRSAGSGVHVVDTGVGRGSLAPVVRGLGRASLRLGDDELGAVLTGAETSGWRVHGYK